MCKAFRRSVNSRNAVRLSSRKKPSSARSTCALGCTWQRLSDGHSSQNLHRLIQAGHMLDIHSADDVDAVLPQVEHVLVALEVLRAGHVGVGQLVHERYL